jgi:putative nucleotidyltransferase-like protein
MTTASAGPGPEWELLELLCRGLDQELQAAELTRLVRGGLHWGDLLDHALRHKMLTLLAYAVIESGVVEGIPIRLLEHLHSVLALNRYRRGVWYHELGRVTGAMQAIGLAVAARKGAAYESTVYRGNGSRWIGDLDLLIRADDREPAVAVLEELGYQCGLFDFRADVVVPFAREEIIKYRLNPDHLPTYTFVTGDGLVPIIEVDCATSLTWARAPYQVDVAEVLADRNTVVVDVPPPVAVPVPLPIYQFLDTVLHLFREAWFEWWLDKEQDVDLMKFGDVIRLGRAYHGDLAGGRFRDLVYRHGVSQPVAWVLVHLDRTFGTALTRDLQVAPDVTEAFLASAAASGPDVAVWNADMRARLFARDRRALLAPT